jgi:hypothetical protein
MINQFNNFWKPYASILLFLVVLAFTACNSATIEPGVESLQESSSNVLSTGQPYPAPEQLEFDARVQSAYPAPALNTTPASATAVPTAPPPPICDFKPPVEQFLALSETTQFESSDFRVLHLEQEMFGFGIANWLPDNQRLLVTTGDASVGTISTINIVNGEIQHFADRIDIASQPVWLENEEAVMFIDVTERGWEAKLSRGGNKSIETMQTNLASAHLSLNPELQEVTTLLPNMPPVSLASTGEVNQLFDKEPQIGLSSIPLSSDDAYKLAWSSDGRWLAQYGLNGFFLFDMDTKHPCLLDLGSVAERGDRWGIHAQWSSDNRYLGIITAVNYPGQLVSSTELTVVDFQTGLIDVFTPNSANGFWHDFAWSPYDHGMVAKIAVEQKDGVVLDGLYFVDISNASSTRLLPETTFYAGIIGQGLSWSPNGKLIAITCPNGPLCLLNVIQ